MDRVAHLVKKTRDETFRATWTAPDGTQKRINQTPGIASLGGATIDNGGTYVKPKLTRSLGMVFLENQARI